MSIEVALIQELPVEFIICLHNYCLHIIFLQIEPANIYIK